MRFKWYVNRMRLMSIKEVFFYRIFQFLNTKFLFRLKIYNYRSKQVEVSQIFNGPEYSREDLEELFKAFEWNNSYHFFETKVDLSSDLCWRKDYKNSIVSPKSYSGNINKQDFEKHGDVKYISELSRLHFLPFLAFRNVVQGRVNSKDVFEVLKKWENDNPFGYSINYTSGIECAIRSVNLIYTHHILNTFNILNTETDLLIKELVDKHYFFLKNHLSLYSSANNHFVGELLGLSVISSYFQGGRISKNNKWQQKFLNKLLSKYNKDGMDDELSMRYHLAVTDHCINGIKFIENSGFKLLDGVIEQLMKVRDFTRHINYFGNDSNFGDNDSSFLINPFFSEDFSYSDSIFESLNIYLSNKRSTQSIDFRNYLIFGRSAYESKRCELDKLNSKAFLDSGYVFLYDNLNQLKLTFDIGSIGDNRLMAHGHSDQLSFTIQKGDCEFLVDPGSFQYHKRNLKWRNYFRDIQAHNCVSINEKSHALNINRMSWAKASNVSILNCSISKELSVIEAKTDAFENQGADYKRKVVFDALNKCITITDHIESNKKCEFKASFYLHFHPDVILKHNESIINGYLPNGKEIKISNTIFCDSKLLKGDLQRPFGWYSEAYDRKRESFSLISEFIVQKELIITTKIFY